VVGIAPIAAGDGVSWRPIPGEDGHVAFAPLDDFEVDLLRHIRVSVERIVCGDGLVALNGFLMALSGKSLSSAPTAAAMAKSALEDDSIARDAVMRFLAILRSFAGDCVLLFSARGGVYLGVASSHNSSRWWQTVR